MWAHYSDKHRGLCLGFEIPQITGDPKDDTDCVKYVQQLLPTPSVSRFDEMTESEHDEFARNAIFTKFAHWIYEREIRIWSCLVNEEAGLYFVPFGEDMRLAEVIVGQKSSISRAAIVGALGGSADEVNIFRVRAAYNKFEMVEDEQAME